MALLPKRSEPISPLSHLDLARLDQYRLAYTLEAHWPYSHADAMKIAGRLLFTRWNVKRMGGLAEPLSSSFSSS